MNSPSPASEVSNRIRNVRECVADVLNYLANRMIS